jgi:hypothetical protein
MGRRSNRASVQFRYNGQLVNRNYMTLKAVEMVLEEGVEPSRPVKGAGF